MLSLPYIFFYYNDILIHIEYIPISDFKCKFEVSNIIEMNMLSRFLHGIINLN